jgi:hypothetical protein
MLRQPQYDPKEAAKRRLSEAKADAKAAALKKETRGMKPLSSFFGARTEATKPKDDNEVVAVVNGETPR